MAGRTKRKPIRCVYVSNASMYKHQWVVVKAIGHLRTRGHNIELTLAGGGSGQAMRKLEQEIARTDAQRKFVKCLGFVRHDDLPALLADANLFVFASSCENMPNTLVEAMAVGLTDCVLRSRSRCPRCCATAASISTRRTRRPIAEAIENADPGRGP